MNERKNAKQPSWLPTTHVPSSLAELASPVGAEERVKLSDFWEGLRPMIEKSIDENIARKKGEVDYLRRFDQLGNVVKESFATMDVAQAEDTMRRLVVGTTC